MYGHCLTFRIVDENYFCWKIQQNQDLSQLSECRESERQWKSMYRQTTIFMDPICGFFFPWSFVFWHKLEKPAKIWQTFWQRYKKVCQTAKFGSLFPCTTLILCHLEMNATPVLNCKIRNFHEVFIFCEFCESTWKREYKKLVEITFCIYPYKFHGREGHVRNTLFHFCQLWVAL